jgi:hypothetical protein
VSSIQTVSTGNVTCVRVSGAVDESFNQDTLGEIPKGHAVIVNLKAVSRVDSPGVEAWSQAMAKFSASATKVYYIECSPAVVAQLNRVASFSGDAQIVSVQAPMACPKCQWTALLVVDMTKHSPASLPTMTCSRCGEGMSIDALPELYFAFDARTEAQLDPAIEAVVNDFERLLPQTSETPLEPQPEAQAELQPEAQPEAVVDEVETLEPEPLANASSLSDRELSFAKKKPPYALIGMGAVLVLGLGFWLGTRQAQPDPPPLPNAKPKVEPASQQAVSQPASEPASTPTQPPTPKVDGAAEKAKALTALAAKDFETTVRAGQLARDNGSTDLELLFALAEAHKKLTHAEEAAALYSEIEQTLPAKDKRLERVLFDHADLLATGAAPLAAVPLYERLIKEFPKSKKAAKAKIAKLKKRPKKKR